MSKEKSTRREIGRKAVEMGTISVLAPSFIGVTTADTPSGNVEIETTATVPTNTNIEITVFEDTNGSGSANRQQDITIDDGTNTYQLDLLQSTVAQGDVLWLDVNLSTSDDSITPKLDSSTLTLPEGSEDTDPGTGGGTETPDNPDSLNQILNNYLVFVSVVVLGVTSIGLWAKSLAIGAFIGYVTFAYLAVTTQTPLLVNILYITAVLVFIGMAFKLFRAEFGGE